MFPYKTATEFVWNIRRQLVKEGWIQHIDEDISGLEPEPDNNDEYWEWYNARSSVNTYLMSKLMPWCTSLDLYRTGWRPTITDPREIYLKVIAAAMGEAGMTAGNVLDKYTTIDSKDYGCDMFFKRFMLYRDLLGAHGIGLTERFEVSNGMRAVGADTRLIHVHQHLLKSLEKKVLTTWYFIDELREACNTGKDGDLEYETETEDDEDDEDEDMDEVDGVKVPG